MDWTLTDDLVAAVPICDPERPMPRSTETLLRVGFVGERQAWLSLEAAKPNLEPIEAFDARPRGAVQVDVVHVAAQQLDAIRSVRRAWPDAAVVADLTGSDALRLGRSARRRLEDADLMLVGSLMELRELRRRQPSLAARSRLLREPVDLDAFAPEPVLGESRGRDLRRHRREYRLVATTVLFAGPYTEAGGLDLLLEAVYAIRKDVEPALRLCAVPLGPVDSRYLNRVERHALRLGHHAPIQWSVGDAELPLWFACADLVCVPSRRPLHPLACLLAGASGTPFVGTESDLAQEHVDGSNGLVVPPNDLDALTTTLAALVADGDDRMRLGAQARARAEDQLSPAAAAGRLRQLWADAATARV
jgi:glycosyltransferase involved in cell wall biosynthesis